MRKNDNRKVIRWLTYLMFLMFAMTTDAVGVIIPEVMRQFQLSMTEAGLIHYAPMAAIALAGIFLGYLSDAFGRKFAIALGLSMFTLVCFFFMFGNHFYYFLTLMVVSGAAIGIFKTAALGLIGDISRSSSEHTTTVNGVEAFFAIGAILGPLIVTYLLSIGVDWKWLYFIAGGLCIILLSLALRVQYPAKLENTKKSDTANLKQTFLSLKDPYALGFSLGAFLYVASESAIYVWMPTYLLGYSGSAVFVATYALTIFFVLRAIGRFLGMWLIARLNWSLLLTICSGLIALCFFLSITLGKEVAVFLLPLSGLFMSVIYPTLNSKGISCFEKNKHCSVAGIILFFTALGAALGPLIMGLVSDANQGQAVYGFIVATVFACILFGGLLLNLLFSLAEKRLQQLEGNSSSGALSASNTANSTVDV